MAEIIEAAHHHQWHEHPEDGRHASVSEISRGVVGVVSNTPLLLGRVQVLQSMVETARSTIARSDQQTASALCRSLFEDLHESSEEFMETTTPDEEAMRARCDLDGCAGFVAARGSELYVGRLGDIRVVGVTQTKATILLREHTLAGQRAEAAGSRCVSPIRHMLTSCFASPALPADVVAPVDLPGIRGICMGTPELFDFVLMDALPRLLGPDPLEDLVERWVYAGMDRWEGPRRPATLLMVRLGTDSHGVLR